MEKTLVRGNQEFCFRDVGFQVLRGEIGEGKGNPLQYSCLENPRDGRGWWAAIYGVTQSRTRLKRLSSSSSRGGNEEVTDVRAE